MSSISAQPAAVRPSVPLSRLASPHEQADEEQLDLRQYWRTVKKRKWTILGIMLVTGILASLAIGFIKPVYRATATLLIESKPAKIISIQDIVDSGYQNYLYYETQYQILSSRTLAEKVVERQELWRHPAFDPAQQEPAPFETKWRAWFPHTWLPRWLVGPDKPQPLTEDQLKARAIAAIKRDLTIDPVEKSELVHISFDAHDPRLAAKVANAMADGYIESTLDARFQMTQKASVWLSERLQELRAKLDQSEKALQTYRDREGLVDISGVETLAVNDLQAIREQLDRARQRRKDLGDLYSQMQTGAKQTTAGSESPAAKDELVQSLKLAEVEAQRQIAEFSKRYGPQHPKMIAAQSKLEAVRAELDKALTAAVGGVASEVRAAQANVAQLEKQFEEAKTKVQQVNRKEFEVQQLDRDVQANRQLYDTFLTRAKQTDVGSGDVQAATARVVDPAIPPGGAIWPDKKRILGTSLLLALLAGIGIAFFLERLDNTLKTGEDVEEKLHEPVLGILPALRQQGAKRTPPERAFIDQNQSHFAEAIRTVRTSVLLSGLDNPHKCVLVTSSLVGEGKTTVAMNLAFALAHLQKVLLIDADMRRPSLGEMCGFNRDAPGLSNLIAGTASAAECIRKVADSDVHVLPAGIIPPNPLELLSSQKVALLLEKLGNIYERIVIDSAPAQIVSDPLVLAQHANAVIYVAKADVTPYQVVSAGIKRLREVDAPVIGVVLNRVDLEKVAKYGKYGYYKQYYANYGYYRKAS